MSKRHTHGVGINIPMCIASILLCFTLFSIHLTCGLYARYTTTASSSDSARVIKFGNLTIVEEGDFVSGSGNQMIVAPGVDLKKNVELTFTGSESSTFIFMEVVLNGSWTRDSDTFTAAIGSNKLSWAFNTVDKDNLPIWTFLSGSDNSYVYYTELAPNEVLTNVPIIKDAKIVVNKAITKNDLATMKDVTIDFRASVVQSNGFETAAAAWADLKAK